jgi:hypothetical protein
VSESILELIAFATELDRIGLRKEADIIDSVSEQMTDDLDVISDLLKFVSEEDAKELIEEASFISQKS